MLDFSHTHLPSLPVFEAGFKAGWTRYLLRFQGDMELAASQYLRGPVALARLIFEHGGDMRHVAVAGCLAGPAAFSGRPDADLDDRLQAFTGEVRGVDIECGEDLQGLLPRLSADARVFFQASAIMLLEHVADPVTGGSYAPPERRKMYEEALALYSAARGPRDLYRLDTRFEIAAMKVTMVLEDQSHLWAVKTGTFSAHA